ncbi:FecR family protein [Chitinophaga lutea]
MRPKEEHIDNLLQDNRFIDWVLNPQSPYAGYWLAWMAESEENAALAAEARAFLLDLHMAEEQGGDLSDDRVEDMLAGLKTAMVKEPKSHSRTWMAIAAAVALLITAGAWWQWGSSGKNNPDAQRKGRPANEMVRYNGNAADELLYLPDGSKVVLGPGARISYNALLAGDRREITLTGDAFFDVAQDPQKPFYIYTPNVVVKVLGTSFRVSASGREESVAVRTGKVSVYLKGQDLEQSAARIVLPQQVCKYTGDARGLITEVYGGAHPEEAQLQKAGGLVFQDAPLAQVLDTLEKMYAIPVRFDRDTFANCYITISLGNENLEESLNVITRTIDASYSISAYGIAIHGKGCP